MVLLLVFGRVLSASWANVLQKQLARDGLKPLLIVAITFVILALLVVPGMYYFPLTGLTWAFWGSLLVAILLDVPGNMALVKSVSMTDLSLIGPLNAYKPIVGLLLGIVIVGEVPDVQGLLGVAVIFSGTLFLSPGGESAGLRAFAALMKNRGVQFRFLSLVMTASAAVFLKAAINVSTAEQTFVAWALTGVPVAFVCVMASGWPRMAEVAPLIRSNMARLVFLALLFLMMQLLTLQVFALMYVGYALALFQLSALVNVIFGYTVFKEPHILRRAFASLIMIVGAVLLILST